MLRGFYRTVLGMHPPRFRQRFGCSGYLMRPKTELPACVWC